LQTASDPWLDRRPDLRIIHRILDHGLQIVDRITDCQPFAIDYWLGDDLAAASDIFADRVGQP
jgi:hypothetical protein